MLSSATCLLLHPRGHPFPFIVHYFWPGPRSKVVHYRGNRVPFGGHPLSRPRAIVVYSGSDRQGSSLNSALKVWDSPADQPWEAHRGLPEIGATRLHYSQARMIWCCLADRYLVGVPPPFHFLKYCTRSSRTLSPPLSLHQSQQHDPQVSVSMTWGVSQYAYYRALHSRALSAFFKGILLSTLLLG